MAEQKIIATITICPRHWVRLWRYRWIVRFRARHIPGATMDGYAWTFRGAKQAATDLVSEAETWLTDMEMERG